MANIQIFRHSYRRVREYNYAPNYPIGWLRRTRLRYSSPTTVLWFGGWEGRGGGYYTNIIESSETFFDDRYSGEMTRAIVDYAFGSRRRSFRKFVFPLHPSSTDLYDRSKRAKMPRAWPLSTLSGTERTRSAAAVVVVSNFRPDTRPFPRLKSDGLRVRLSSVFRIPRHPRYPNSLFTHTHTHSHSKLAAMISLHVRQSVRVKSTRVDTRRSYVYGVQRVENNNNGFCLFKNYRRMTRCYFRYYYFFVLVSFVSVTYTRAALFHHLLQSIVASVRVRAAAFITFRLRREFRRRRHRRQSRFVYFLFFFYPVFDTLWRRHAETVRFS